jgi:hypothetical protein
MLLDTDYAGYFEKRRNTGTRIFNRRRHQIFVTDALHN